MIGLICALYSGYGHVGISTCVLLCEISTFFFNYRLMYEKEELSDFIPTVIQLTFFALVTIYRIIFFPYLTVKGVHSLYYSWDYLDSTRKAAGTFA